MLPPNYRLRLVEPADFEQIVEICRRVYPTERPYSLEELDDHQRLFPQGQFAAVEHASGAVAGVHFTLRLRISDFHVDDSWDVLTADGSFLDHDPQGQTLYGADIMVHPEHQHHGIAHALTDQARFLVQDERLWRMVGASRLPGFRGQRGALTIDDYVNAVIAGSLFDPVLSIHLKDGWAPVRPIHGYLQHDEDSDGWAEVIQWVNPDCPPPEDVDLGNRPASQ
ncbi:MAG: GNAT family N-acetyltransferase [Planctomycetaceae bacterium]|nr:GNAT family N-acetyltransferase [Planctomycetaceae bacterium]